MSPRPATWADAKARIAASPKRDFATRFRLAGLDPSRDARYADWADIDFEGSDLAGFDFTGAKLFRARFKGAKIRGARFDRALLDSVNHDLRSVNSRDLVRGPHAPAHLEGAARLSDADDWKDYADLTTLRRADRPRDDSHVPTGAIFADHPGLTPELVVIPGGEFWMGSPDGSGGDQGDTPEKGRSDDEGPRHRVSVQRFAIGRFAVTFEEWDAAQEHPQWFAWSGIPKRKPNDEEWGRVRHPVIDVSWNDAKAYCKWLNRLLGLPDSTYRLPSEAEWEYACRAGTDTPFWWGGEIATTQANYNGKFTYGDASHGEFRGRTVPVDSFEPNPWGLQQVHGNVLEWCEDTWHERYEGTPVDGTARRGGDTSLRVLRGGSWGSGPQDLRSALRGGFLPGYRNDGVGFRLARTLLRP